MPAINYLDLKRRYELEGAKKTIRHLGEALREKHLRPHDFSLRELAEAVIPNGREYVARCNPGKSGGFASLQEDTAVTLGTFANITGQLMFTTVLEAFESEEFVFTKLFPTEPTKLSGEKIPGVSRSGDQAEIVQEGQPYPRAGFTEDWISTPETRKRGEIIEVTKEAIFFDLTGLVLQRASEAGEFYGLNKEKRAIDCLIDENTTAHRYNWKGTIYASYQSSSPWDNVTASNALVDWTDIDAAEQTLNGIVDPYTGEPVLVTADTLVCVKALQQTANRIRNATEITVTTPGYATSGNPTETKVENPYRGAFEVLTSRLLAARLATDTTWFFGTPKKYAKYMENWPISVEQAPANNHDEFERDIAAKYKVSERGAFVVVEPRVMTTCTA
jgi:hypothetical protein